MSECKSPIQIGQRYRFGYPAEFTTLPEYTMHAGQMVTVVRQLSEPEVDWENGPNGPDPMFAITADDEWRGTAWSSELEGNGE